MIIILRSIGTRKSAGRPAPIDAGTSGVRRVNYIIYLVGDFFSIAADV